MDGPYRPPRINYLILHSIDSKDRVVLILSHFWTPINITTAKEGIRKLISCGSISRKDQSVKCLSESGEPLYWEEWINPQRATYYEDQPFLSSCNKLYPVPTILLTTSKWVYQTKQKPSLFSQGWTQLKSVCNTR